MSTKKPGDNFRDRCVKLLKEWHPTSSIHAFKARKRQIMIKGELVWRHVEEDLFGCVDIIVHRPHAKELHIQVTLSGSITSRIEKFSKVNWNFNVVDVQLWIGRKDHSIDVRLLRPRKAPVYTRDDKGNLVVDPAQKYYLEDYGKIIRGKFFRKEL